MNKRVIEIIESSKSRGWILEPDAKEILKLHGISVPESRWIKKISGIKESAAGLKFPLAVKVVSAQALHKSEAGGVALGIKNTADLEEIFNKMSSIPGFEGVLAEEMASGAELIFGAKDDPQFGTVVMAGIGGITVEVYRDVVFRLAPVTEKDALSAIESLKGIALLKGFRGTPPADLTKAAKLLSDFSVLAYEYRNYFESIDLNPVLCGSNSATAADARFILSGKQTD